MNKFLLEEVLSQCVLERKFVNTNELKLYKNESVRVQCIL